MAQRFTLKIGDHLLTAETKRAYTEKVFSEVARKYDFITRALSFRQDAVWKNDLINLLPPHKAPVCVDLACGTGDISFLLANKYPHSRITGLDIAEPMLDIARRRNMSPNIRFTRQNMGDLVVASESADIVTGGYALRNAPDLEEIIGEVHRILKPGGTAAFLDFSKPESPFLQRLEYWILKIWGGFWGIVLHGNPEVYGYIAESLQHFPDRVRLRKMFWNKGFLVRAYRSHFFGMTAILVVRKRSR
jgi:ubiquinone/menaquinone biosynthesis methyltransferase